MGRSTEATVAIDGGASMATFFLGFAPSSPSLLRFFVLDCAMVIVLWNVPIPEVGWGSVTRNFLIAEAAERLRPLFSRSGENDPTRTTGRVSVEILVGNIRTVMTGGTGFSWIEAQI